MAALGLVGAPSRLAPPHRALSHRPGGPPGAGSLPRYVINLAMIEGAGEVPRPRTSWVAWWPLRVEHGRGSRVRAAVIHTDEARRCSSAWLEPTNSNKQV